ncbi:MAG: DUF4249 domain-containing protein [Bacteroidales bacterium]|nr:DUF4249 domain-containing protein [Bacteroidales bacterium]
MKINIISTTAITIAASMALASCEKEIKFTGSQQKTSIVLMSLADPDGLLSAVVRQSAFILDNNSYQTIQKGLPDANLKLFVNGRLTGIKAYLDNDASANSTFNFYYRPTAGENIRIEVEADGFTSVAAETTIPQKAKFDVVSFRAETGSYNEEKNIYMKIRIDDPAAEKNYYRLSLSQVFSMDAGDDIWTEDSSGQEGGEESSGRKDGEDSRIEYTSPLKFYSKDPIFEKEGFGHIFEMDEDTEIKDYFSDSWFDGESYTFEIYFSLYSTEYVKTNAIDINLQAMSREYYEYTASLDAYYATEDFSLFSEPVQIICNVENGIGCLGSTTSCIRRVDVGSAIE